MLIVGDWNFLKMSSNYLTSLADQLLKEHKITKQPNVRVGPFSSLIVPVLPRLAMERFIQLIDLHVKPVTPVGVEVMILSCLILSPLWPNNCAV